MAQITNEADRAGGEIGERTNGLAVLVDRLST